MRLPRALTFFFSLLDALRARYNGVGTLGRPLNVAHPTPEGPKSTALLGGMLLVGYPPSILDSWYRSRPSDQHSTLESQLVTPV